MLNNKSFKVNYPIYIKDASENVIFTIGTHWGGNSLKKTKENICQLIELFYLNYNNVPH